MKFAKRVCRLQRCFTRTMAVLVVMKALAKKDASRVCVFRTWPALERKLFLKKAFGHFRSSGKRTPRSLSTSISVRASIPPHVFPPNWVTLDCSGSDFRAPRVNSQDLGISQVSRLPFSNPFRNCWEQRSMLRHVDTKFLNVDCLKLSYMTDAI